MYKAQRKRCRSDPALPPEHPREEREAVSVQEAVLQLQRSVGNVAVCRLIAGRAAGNDSAIPVSVRRSRAASGRAMLQRDFTPYGWLAMTGAADPENVSGVSFNERIPFIRHTQRAAIPAAVKGAVDGFGDGDGVGVYKHYVPYKRIAVALVGHLEGHTRNWICGRLQLILGEIGLPLPAAGLTVHSAEIQFDTWVNEAMEAICDHPRNIFRHNFSSGDHGGTTLDVPAPGAPAGLAPRLNACAQALNEAIGVDIT